LTFDFVLGIWVALCVLTGLYLLGLFRLPHDSPVENIGVPRLLFSIAFIGLGLYLSPALFKSQRPTGAVYAWIDAFLLPDATETTSGHSVTANLPLAVAELREHNTKYPAQPKRIFLDFTGEICANCRYNEEAVFRKSEIKELLQSYTEVQIYTDGVPRKFYAPEVRAQLALDSSRSNQDAEVVNQQFEHALVDTVELPKYAVLEPLPDGRVQLVGQYDESRILNPEAFAEFLRNPEKWQQKK
jgi:hypothetical protein